MRYDKRYAEGWFRRLAHSLGKVVAEGEDFHTVGAWEFDYNSLYGGAVIEEIMNEHRGVTRPLTEYHLRPFEFSVMCQAVINAVREVNDANS